MVALPFSSLPVPAPPSERLEPRRRPAELWLAVHVLEPARDLESLADFAYRLTPTIVIEPCYGLLLEIRGSLVLLGGLDAIKQRMAYELERRGLSYRLATAPTPLAAAWLARLEGGDVGAAERLPGAVGRLPLAATGWSERTLLQLRQMGLCTIADCLRLPRAGFARRIGKHYLDELDRALGRTPDIRAGYARTEHLSETVELASETIDRTLLGMVLDNIVARFAAELRRRQAQVQKITLELAHPKRADTLTRFRFVDAVHEHERMLAPLLARLERIALDEPAIGLTLKTGRLQPLEIVPPSLGWERIDRRIGVAPEFALIERLRGRFGEHRVHGIGLVAEHRPELAWCRWLERPLPPADASAVPAAERPLWLLPKRGQTPFSLARKRGLTSPERIETGWWDGRPLARDYHVVIGAHGERLWAYRDRRTREWYLQGLFG